MNGRAALRPCGAPTTVRCFRAVRINGNIDLEIELNMIGELVIPVADGVVIHDKDKR